MFSIMKAGVLAAAVGALVVLGFGVGYYFYYTSNGPSTSASATVTTNAADDIVKSAINTSSACSPRSGSWESSGAMDSLRSNVMSQPAFMELAHNGSYSDAGYGCSLANGTQFIVDFEYSDMAHPFHICGNDTAYPTYYIEAKIYLLPAGYDLSKTTYSMRYYDSQNLTVSCSTEIG